MLFIRLRKECFVAVNVLREVTDKYDRAGGRKMNWEMIRIRHASKGLPRWDGGKSGGVGMEE